MPLISCFQLVFISLPGEWQGVYTICFMSLDSSKTVPPLTIHIQYLYFLGCYNLCQWLLIFICFWLPSVTATKFYWTSILCKNLLLLLLSRFSCVRPSATPWTAAYQAPPSMGFSRQEYWSGVPLPSPARIYSEN